MLDHDAGVWAPASFHARYELWALYEDWRDVPDEIRMLLNDWELDDYLDEVGAGIAAIREGRAAESDQLDYTYLLLDEAEALLRSRERIYLWPCNCRAMMGKCDQLARRLPALRQRPRHRLGDHARARRPHPAPGGP